MKFGKKIFFVKLIYLFSQVFFTWTFFNFLACCGLLCQESYMKKVELKFSNQSLCSNLNISLIFICKFFSRHCSAKGWEQIWPIPPNSKSSSRICNFFRLRLYTYITIFFARNHFLCNRSKAAARPLIRSDTSLLDLCREERNITIIETGRKTKRTEFISKKSTYLPTRHVHTMS